MNDSERDRQLEAIHKLRGLHRRDRHDKSFADEWAEHKAEEIRVEESKWERLFLDRGAAKPSGHV